MFDSFDIALFVSHSISADVGYAYYSNGLNTVLMCQAWFARGKKMVHRIFFLLFLIKPTL